MRELIFPSQAKLVRSGVQLPKKQPLQPLVSSGTPLECVLSPISPWDSTQSRALYTLSFPALFPTLPDSLSFFYVLVFPVLIRWAQAHVLNWSYALTSKTPELDRHQWYQHLGDWGKRRADSSILGSIEWDSIAKIPGIAAGSGPAIVYTMPVRDT